MRDAQRTGGCSFKRCVTQQRAWRTLPLSAAGKSSTCIWLKAWHAPGVVRRSCEHARRRNGVRRRQPWRLRRAPAQPALKKLWQTALRARAVPVTPGGRVRPGCISRSLTRARRRWRQNSVHTRRRRTAAQRSVRTAPCGRLGSRTAPCRVSSRTCDTRRPCASHVASAIFTRRLRKTGRVTESVQIPPLCARRALAHRQNARARGVPHQRAQPRHRSANSARVRYVSGTPAVRRDCAQPPTCAAARPVYSHQAASA
jgi:hypothetical protein